jgi:hypothetical protein
MFMNKVGMFMNAKMDSAPSSFKWVSKDLRKEITSFVGQNDSLVVIIIN